jgi:hypothetical protein
MDLDLAAFHSIGDGYELLLGIITQRPGTRQCAANPSVERERHDLLG